MITPTDTRVAEFGRQEWLAQANRLRLIQGAAATSPTRPRVRPVALLCSYARLALASLASVAFIQGNN